MTKIVVVTSGKGGVGKTTTSAALATGLALRGFKTTVIDFDVGLRNLDLIMGCERRVVYDLVNVISGDANIKQALIKDKKVDNLFILPASQTRDKDALTTEGVEGVLNALRDDMKMDYIICDSRHAEQGDGDIPARLLLTRYSPERVESGQMLSVEDVQEILAIELLGVIPESQAVLNASNSGSPVILDIDSDAGQAYSDAVARFLGDQLPHRFVNVNKKGLFGRLFGG